MRNRMNVNELSKNLEKARIYKNEEQLCFSNIKDVLETINFNYDSSNTNRLEELYTDMVEKLNVINAIHNNNIFVIEKNIANYIKTNKDTEKVFKDLVDR